MSFQKDPLRLPKTRSDFSNISPCPTTQVNPTLRFHLPCVLQNPKLSLVVSPKPENSEPIRFPSRIPLQDTSYRPASGGRGKGGKLLHAFLKVVKVTDKSTWFPPLTKVVAETFLILLDILNAVEEKCLVIAVVKLSG